MELLVHPIPWTQSCQPCQAGVDLNDLDAVRSRRNCRVTMAFGDQTQIYPDLFDDLWEFDGDRLGTGPR